jgi:hypothetical protein
LRIPFAESQDDLGGFGGGDPKCNVMIGQHLGRDDPADGLLRESLNCEDKGEGESLHEDSPFSRQR